MSFASLHRHVLRIAASAALIACVLTCQLPAQKPTEDKDEIIKLIESLESPVATPKEQTAPAKRAEFLGIDLGKPRKTKSSASTQTQDERAKLSTDPNTSVKINVAGHTEPLQMIPAKSQTEQVIRAVTFERSRTPGDKIIANPANLDVGFAYSSTTDAPKPTHKLTMQRIELPSDIDSGVLDDKRSGVLNEDSLELGESVELLSDGISDYRDHVSKQNDFLKEVFSGADPADSADPGNDDLSRVGETPVDLSKPLTTSAQGIPGLNSGEIEASEFLKQGSEKEQGRFVQRVDVVSDSDGNVQEMEMTSSVALFYGFMAILAIAVVFWLVFSSSSSGRT